MMNPLIIKLGGVLLDSEEALERLFSALVNYRESHQRQLVIVHGGGCVVDELMRAAKSCGEVCGICGKHHKKRTNKP